MREAFLRATAVVRREDEYGHYRARENENAMNIADKSAALATSLAKLRGHFQHDIRVTRVEEATTIASPSRRWKTPCRRQKRRLAETEAGEELIMERMAAYPTPSNREVQLGKRTGGSAGALWK